MYLHLAQDKAVRTGEIVGIFDTDKVTLTRRGQRFLNEAQRAGTLWTLGDDLPKSVVVTAEAVYLCQMNPSTLKKRLEEAQASRWQPEEGGTTR